MREIKNAAVIVSPRIGDVIFCTPAIHILKCNLNFGKIYAIVLSEASAQVFENNPDIDSVYVCPNRKIISEVSNKIDFIVDFYNNRDTQKYVKLMKRPYYSSLRSMYGIHQGKVATNFVCDIFSDDPEKYDLSYRLFHLPLHSGKVKELLKARRAKLDGNEILVGCHMGTYNFARRSLMFWKRKKLSTKTWPFENFVALGKMLFEYDKRIRLVLTGTRGEKKLVKYFAGYEEDIIDVIGETSVLELKVMMEFLKAFITPDTGPMHVAASTKVPIIDLCCSLRYSQYTTPYPLKPWHHIICKDSMKDILPQEVFDTVVRSVFSSK
jgi:ADP-heptose:LPS heptosyltransferase